MATRNQNPPTNTPQEQEGQTGSDETGGLTGSFGAPEEEGSSGSEESGGIMGSFGPPEDTDTQAQEEQNR